MAILRRVINNTIISFVGQVVTWTSTLLLTLAYGRFLGATKFGELYFAMTFVLLMGILIETGYDQQITRGVSQEPDKALRYCSNVLLIKVGIWLVVYGLILLLSWLLGYSVEVRMLIGICGLTLLSDAIGNTFAWLHYAFERVIVPVVGSILQKGLSALIGYLLLKNGAGVQTMAFVLLAGSLVNGIWQAVWFFRLLGISFVLDSALIRELLRTNIPFLIYGALSVIYGRIDTVLLSLMTNDTVVGWYGASYRLYDTLNFLPNIVIMTIMYPVFMKFSVTSDANLKLAIEKSMNFLLVCALPITTGLIITAPNIISLLYYRAEFAPAVSSLQALATSIIFLYLNYSLITVILSKKQDRKIPIMAGIAMVFNIGLNLIFIPMYQHVGAAIVTSLTEALLFCLSLAFIPKHLLSWGSLRVGAKALLASLVMALAIWNLRAFSLFVILPVAMLVYLGAATLLGTIPREDMLAIYHAIRHKEATPLEPFVDDITEKRKAILPSALVRFGNSDDEGH